MGSVFAARHVGLDKPVALKTLHPTLASREAQVVRFVREGRAASRIRHPHVVDVTDVGTHEGIPFLVMEYLEGEDLQTRLESCHLFTPTELARILLPVIDAVAVAHDKGVVHRDLKPSNVFLERGPHGVDIPKVLDFGIAKILDTEGVSQKTITQAAVFLGTPYYGPASAPRRCPAMASRTRCGSAPTATGSESSGWRPGTINPCASPCSRRRPRRRPTGRRRGRAPPRLPRGR